MVWSHDFFEVSYGFNQPNKRKVNQRYIRFGDSSYNGSRFSLGSSNRNKYENNIDVGHQSLLVLDICLLNRS